MIFVGMAILVISVSMIKTFVFTKTDTENSIKANAILYNVNNLAKAKSTKKQSGNLLHSIYELNLPISSYLIKENNSNDITFMNDLQKKVLIYKKNHPLKEASCILLNNDKLLTTSEFQKCLSIENYNFNWIQDNKDGLEYNINDDDIAKKLNLTNKDDNNKIITDNNYLFKNYSNNIVRTKKINDLIETLQSKQKNKEYISTLKILYKIKSESSKKSINLLEDILNNNDYLSQDTITNEQILKNVLYIVLDNEGNLLINDNFPNIENYLNKNYNYIYDTLNSMTYYKIKDQAFFNIKKFLNKG
jgi:uncharacterized protein YihD (DUF1040 family)